MSTTTDSVQAAMALPKEVRDLDQWVELSHSAGLTDGLPVLPPTRQAVDELVLGARRSASERLGEIPPRGGTATVEVVAANAAMAGCLPEHMPVLIAAVGALLDRRFNLNGVQVTTHGCWPLLMVSGPVVRALGMATEESIFNGGGSRASASLGRALRLLLWNVGGAHPGESVKEVFGHPGRYAYCIAEREEHPWTALHEVRGLLREESAVTVFACESPHSVAFWGLGGDPEERLLSVADTMHPRGSNNTHTMGEVLVAFSPSEVRHLHARGYSRERVQERLFELSKRRVGEIRSRARDAPATYEWWPDSIDQSDDDALVPIVDGPEAIHLIVAGADSIPWAAVCPGWGHIGGYAVTRIVESRDCA
ncbi:MAG: hypothetical protein CL908_24540 [Deltaproteobacteria bacterium]|nr:hypothetical protein [Deltaproteobacteria bacterium]